MRFPRVVLSVLASIALVHPASRVLVVAAGALATSGCEVDCTVGQITPELLPDGRVGQAYFVQIVVETSGADCRRPRFGVTDGLPRGMKVSEDGALDGVPAAPGWYSFTVNATVGVDNPNEIVDLRFVSRTYELVILPL